MTRQFICFHSTFPFTSFFVRDRKDARVGVNVAFVGLDTYSGL
jgi:hypothetical protein